MCASAIILPEQHFDSQKHTHFHLKKEDTAGSFLHVVEKVPDQPFRITKTVLPEHYGQG